MKCEKCHEREATVFITQNINGEVLEMNLCEICAGELEQPILDDSFPFQQFLTGFIGNVKAGESTDVVTCANCGMSLQEFKRHSKVGCAQCYMTFNADLMPIIKRLHGTVHHSGKVPGRISSLMKNKKTLDYYESQLKVALMKEDYEEAARFRDLIRELKRGDDL